MAQADPYLALLKEMGLEEKDVSIYQHVKDPAHQLVIQVKKDYSSFECIERIMALAEDIGDCMIFFKNLPYKEEDLRYIAGEKERGHGGSGYGINYIKNEGNKTTINITCRTYSLGSAKGRAVVINRDEDLEKVDNESIIILEDSTPVMIPYLVKSKAMVSGCGGMLCHTAVVSREFGIPCVGNVGNAGKVIRNGDEIEINARGADEDNLIVTRRHSKCFV